LMQTRCSILLSIADKMKHETEKALVWKQCLFTARCHVAEGCNRLAEVWLWPPLSSYFTEAVTTITVQEFSVSNLYASTLTVGWILFMFHI
jgi:hypothetical protein